MKSLDDEIHEKMRKKLSPCKDGERADFVKISEAHGGCTGVDAENLQDTLLNQYKMLYLFHCKDGSLTYVCLVCRICFSTLESAVEHFEKVHGLN